MSNFHPLEFVGRGSETQLQVGESENYLIKRFEPLIFTQVHVLNISPICERPR